ncbi:MAG: hypothetical protein ACSHX6_03630 [Akkermansiaceae bacterium]
MKIKQTIKNALFGKPVLLQQKLLEASLREIGIKPKLVKIEIDHLNGYSMVNGYSLGIIYPVIFFELCENLPNIKKYKYYFNGAMPDLGGRREMLESYIDDDNNLIISSQQGRNNRRKGKFNKDYYSHLKMAQFTLCPHQTDWTGPKSTMWTYRFIEACMGRSIPITFRSTPLGEDFIKGFHVQWDDEKNTYEESLTSENFELAKQKFTLSGVDITKIKDTL